MSASETSTLEEAVECLLFISDTPVSVSALARALESEEAETQEAVEKLASRLARGSGLQIVQIAGGYQLSTKPVYAGVIARFLQPQKQRLSKPALETLAIIAYRQPVTLAEVEEVRGVNCDGMLKSLVDRRLVQEVGRKPVPGRPILYGTTQEFLHQFGLKGLDELPPVEQLEAEVKD